MNATLSLAKLTSNPFTLVPTDPVTTWAGYTDLRSTLLDMVRSCRSDQVGLSEFAILYGDLGTGKSHALRYLRHVITEQEREEFSSPCVYLETLKLAGSMNFLALYKKVMDQLIPHIRETAEWLDIAVEDTARLRIPDGRQSEQREEMKRIYADPDITPGYPPLARLLEGINSGSTEALTILLGEKLTGANAMGRYGAFGMTGTVDSEYEATRCLGAYVNLCTRGTSALNEGEAMARNKAFYFFLDELELLADFRPQEALSINQGLRDLINSCPENCSFLLGMTGDVRGMYGLLTQAVIRRMSRDPLEIQPLARDDAVEFLRQVLRDHRSNADDPDEYPFSRGALMAIVEATQIKTPSELFRVCRRVLERSVLTGALEEGGVIDDTMVAQAL